MRDSTNFPPNLLWRFIALGSLIWSSPVFIPRAVTFKLCTHGLNRSNYVTPKGDCTHQIFNRNAFPHILFQFPATKEIGWASQPDLIWTLLISWNPEVYFMQIPIYNSMKEESHGSADIFHCRFSLKLLCPREREREREPASSQHNAATAVRLVWYNLSTMHLFSHPFTAFYFSRANCSLCDSVAWL